MAALATDDFNRADTVGPDLGPNWTNVAAGGMAVNGFQIVSNAVAPTTTGSDKLEFYSGVAWPADQYSQAKVTVSGTGADAGVGVAVRCDTDGSQYRAVVNKAGANNVGIHRQIGASFLNLGTRTTTWVDGDALRIEVQGTTIRVYQNGAQLGADVTDTGLASGSAGIAYSSTTTSASMDDWEGGTFSLPSDNPPIGLLGRGAGW